MENLQTKAAQLAKVFSEKIQEWVSAEQFEEIKKRNRTYEKGTCASHDFLDANMAMAEAFEEVCGRGVQIYDGDALQEQDTALWNLAWDIAKAQYLSAPTESTVRVAADGIVR